MYLKDFMGLRVRGASRLRLGTARVTGKGQGTSRFNAGGLREALGTSAKEWGLREPAGEAEAPAWPSM
jgi:hypothetical protein